MRARIPSWGDPTLMTPFKPNYFPEASPPGPTTLGEESFHSGIWRRHKPSGTKEFPRISGGGIGGKKAAEGGTGDSAGEKPLEALKNPDAWAYLRAVKSELVVSTFRADFWGFGEPCCSPHPEIFQDGLIIDTSQGAFSDHLSQSSLPVASSLVLALCRPRCAL